MGQRLLGDAEAFSELNPCQAHLLAGITSAEAFEEGVVLGLHGCRTRDEALLIVRFEMAAIIASCDARGDRGAVADPPCEASI